MYKEWVVYLDFANTLARFCYPWDRWLQKRRMYKKWFYFRLSPIKGARELVNDLRSLGITVKVISGTIDSCYCAKETKMWCRRVLGVREKDVILLPKDKQKADRVPTLDKAILVDDWDYYVDYWRSLGGKAFLKRSITTEKEFWNFGSLKEVYYKVVSVIQKEEGTAAERLVRAAVRDYSDKISRG